MGEKRSLKNISNEENEFADDIVFARFIKYMNIALKHRALNFIRDKRRREKREEKANQTEMIFVKNNNSNTLFKNIDYLKTKKIEKAINNLSTKQRKLIYMMYYEEKTVKEIAIKWNKSVYAIRQMKYRAMINIKRSLKENGK